jgi:hypothetical protein
MWRKRILNVEKVRARDRESLLKRRERESLMLRKRERVLNENRGREPLKK